jgi:hypothetical protein
MDSVKLGQTQGRPMRTGSTAADAQTRHSPLHHAHKYAQDVSSCVWSRQHRVDPYTAGYRLDSGQGLQNCGNDQYCCAENYDCCTNSTNIFSLGIGDIITTIPAMSAPTESSQPSSHSGPSKSVAIGAGVGAGVGGLLVICVAVLLFLRRRRQKSSPGLEGTETAELDSAGLTKYAGPQDVKVGYSAENRPPQIQHELASNERYRPHEMDSNIPYELDGSETEPRDGGVRTYDESSVEESRPHR